MNEGHPRHMASSRKNIQPASRRPEHTSDRSPRPAMPRDNHFVRRVAPDNGITPSRVRNPSSSCGTQEDPF